MDPHPLASPHPSCLSEDEVLAFVAGTVDAETRARTAGHLEGCWPCARLVAFCVTQTDTGGANPGRTGAFAAGDELAGRYRVVRLVGAGGMGEVYEAFDTALGETLAVKTIGLGVPLDQASIVRLKAEVQLARRVTHQNVCRVFDLGFHEQADRRPGAPSITVPFLTMELLGGETLRARLRRVGRLAGGEARTVVEQLAAGLATAHAAGVVHADFKSENIMLLQEAGTIRAVIMDFGLARPLGTASGLSRSGKGLIAGTVGYMAPEQLDGRRATEASDIYALGVVTFEMLTGRLPFPSTSALAAAVEAISSPAPTVRSLGIEVPAFLDALISRCLQADPRARYASMAEVMVALRGPVVAVRTRGWKAAALVSLGLLAGLASAAWLSRSRSSRDALEVIAPAAAIAVPAAVARPAPERVPAASDRPDAAPPATSTGSTPVDRPAHRRPARVRAGAVAPPSPRGESPLDERL
jgi:hypothetical protein